jgi:predicted metalloprotease
VSHATIVQDMPVRRSLALVPVLAALVALGCVSAPRGAQPAPAATTRPGATTSADADGTDTPAEFEQDLGSAQQLAESYWKDQFASSGLQFTPISDLIAYERDGEVDCGAQPLGLKNAAYCSAGDFIAYDVNWAFDSFRQIGDAFIFYLLGHEYAHGVQLRLGIQKQFTIQQELQADCMAGAYIGDSVRADRLSLQDGDLDELARGLRAVGDDPGQPWFAEGAHGTARQRTTEFNKGLEESLRPCNLS